MCDGDVIGNKPLENPNIWYSGIDNNIVIHQLQNSMLCLTV